MLTLKFAFDSSRLHLENPPLQVVAVRVPLIPSYKYLGSMQMPRGGMKAEIAYRAAQAFAAFAEGRRKVFRALQISVARKAFTLRASVLPQLLFGVGSWAPPTGAEHRQFAGVLWRLYRPLLGLYQQDQDVSFHTCLAIVGLPSPDTTLKMQRLLYLGQMMRHGRMPCGLCSGPTVLTPPVFWRRADGFSRGWGRLRRCPILVMTGVRGMICCLISRADLREWSSVLLNSRGCRRVVILKHVSRASVRLAAACRGPGTPPGVMAIVLKPSSSAKADCAGPFMPRMAGCGGIWLPAGEPSRQPDLSQQRGIRKHSLSPAVNCLLPTCRICCQRRFAVRCLSACSLLVDNDSCLLWECVEDNTAPLAVFKHTVELRPLGLLMLLTISACSWTLFSSVTQYSGHRLAESALLTPCRSYSLWALSHPA